MGNKELIVSGLFVLGLVSLVLLNHGPIHSDSFAFLSFGCGDVSVFGELSTYWVLFPCGVLPVVLFNLFFLGLIMFSIWFLLRLHIKIELKYLFLVIFGATPLFFIEALRFENDLVGLGIGLMGLFLIEYGLNRLLVQKKEDWSAIFIISGVGILGFSVTIWLATIILGIIPFFLRFNKSIWWHKIIAGLIFLGGAIMFLPRLNIFSMGTGSAELTPLIGFIMLLPLIYFNKHNPLKQATIPFIILAILQLKFAFLAIPLLAPGLLVWIQTQTQRNQQIIKIALIAMCCVWCFSGFNQFPTQEDNNLANQAIQINQDTNWVILNSWDFKWLLHYKGYSIYEQTNKGNGVKDWNNIPRPSIVIQRFDENKIPFYCEEIAKSEFYSLKICPICWGPNKTDCIPYKN